MIETLTTDHFPLDYDVNNSLMRVKFWLQALVLLGAFDSGRAYEMLILMVDVIRMIM